MKNLLSLSIACLLLIGFTIFFAQDMLAATKLSQRASVTQRVGTTNIQLFNIVRLPRREGEKYWEESCLMIFLLMR